MDYGVASSSSLSYSICNLEMGVTRMRGTSKNPLNLGAEDVDVDVELKV